MWDLYTSHLWLYYLGSQEVQIMLDRATQVVDAIAEDSWAPESAILMPMYHTRIVAEQEAARCTIEEANEQEHAAQEEHRESFCTPVHVPYL